ncbi:hypothetical protein F5B22DRAFT_605305 [Xylaria bambusicola]|uniref:uncharacterized protein n=1 Tax=Xylaria bambusicola TaxID=326684 RepID=UPI002008C3FB|nr:uncharacterized protein F5B22DRAFT_605305 [Xylaria bambusicola]KAI0517205.1 hypothetical protein F5B22DRAFT_605305 [Xylaria bambusicola]
MLPRNMTDEQPSSVLSRSNGCGGHVINNREVNAAARHLLQLASTNCDQHVGLVFDYNLALSTFLFSGFSPADLNYPGLDAMTNVVSQVFNAEKGVVGPASQLMVDAGDTANAITCLKLLGQDESAAKLIEVLLARIQPSVYRELSFSANCNVLLALLYQDTPGDYYEWIMKSIGLLCDVWWTAINRIESKGNVSSLYPTLQFVRAALKLTDLVEKGRLPPFDDIVTKSRIAICLYQACIRTLLEQGENGSWNSSVADTAHAIVILTEARKFDLFRETMDELDSAISRAVKFLKPSTVVSETPLNQAANYVSSFLTETFRLSALNTSAKLPDTLIGSSLREDTSAIPKLIKLWKYTPLFQKVPEWQIRASMIEGTLFRPIVRARRLNIFTRKGVEEDKYFDVIPVAWPTCNYRTRTFAPSCFLFEGMMAALLNYQVDEFIEAVAGVNYADNIPELRQIIDDVIVSISEEKSVDNIYETLWEESAANGISELTNGSAANGAAAGRLSTIDEVKRREVLVPLTKFVTHALKHPSILSSSPWDQKNVTNELRIYLQTHVTQSEDNMLLQQGKFTKGVMREHFFRWVRTTSADHTSATYTFNFISALLGSWIENGQDCFPSTQEKYYAAAACQHLAAMCRMYNDHGSAIRDHDEANVNAVDFPEFGVRVIDSGDIEMTRKKEALFEVAQYERSCIEEAFRRLEAHAAGSRSADARARKSRQMEIWRMFYNVTDLFGQIYVLRDIGSRLTVGNGTPS